MKRINDLKKWPLIALGLAVSLHAGACAWSPSYNYYLINLYQMPERFEGNPGDELPFNQEYAKKRDQLRASKSQEVKTYIGWLDKYSDICGARMNSWDYPTKEELARQQQDLRSINAAAIRYKGKQLKKEYALLRMRTNMVMKRYADNVAFWKQTASKTPEGCYKEKMRNIYANALLNTGKWRAAVEIYAKQQDQESLEWAMRKYCSYAGVKKIAEGDPNSVAVKYLMQRYVNSLQESIDSDFNPETLKEVGMSLVSKNDAAQFISVAKSTAARSEVNDKCIWQTAAAAVEYLLGDYGNAEKDVEKAMTMPGPQRSKDNARAVRFVIKTKDKNCKQEFVVSEFGWLQQKIKEHSKENADFKYDGYYTRIKERALNLNLLPAWQEKADKGSKEYSNTIYALQSNVQAENGELRPGAAFYDVFEKSSSDRLIHFYEALTTGQGSTLDKALLKDVKINAMDIADLIATRLIAEGQFEKALTWTDKVPLSYLKDQNINWYMANRDMDVNRWEKRQEFPNRLWYADTKGTPLQVNPKAVFCKKMLELQKKAAIGNEALRQQTAFTMGSLYLQASCYGDCWFLTHYSQSIADSAWTIDKDYAKAAMEMFDIAAKGSDAMTAAKALCGKAYTAYRVKDNSYWIPWDATDSYFWVKDDRLTRAAYTELYQFVRENPQTEPMVSRCDIGKAFKYSILKK